MARYSISIETNENSISIAKVATKKDALKQGAYYRTGGLGWRGELAEYENPTVVVYDTKKEVEIYNQPLFKYALKK